MEPKLVIIDMNDSETLRLQAEFYSNGTVAMVMEDETGGKISKERAKAVDEEFYGAFLRYCSRRWEKWVGK